MKSWTHKIMVLVSCCMVSQMVVGAAYGQEQSITERHAQAREEFFFPGGDDDTSALPEDDYADAVRDDDSGGLSLEGPFKELSDRDQTAEEIEKEIRQEAFDAALTGLIPMRPEEIRKLLEVYDQAREAIETPIYPTPTPEIATETVSLDPGSKPPVVKVAVDHVTTLNMLDVTGMPWPIKDITFAGEFEIVDPSEGSNTVRIIPLAEFARGNMVVSLLTLKTPIVFTIETRRDEIHYRFDARIPQFGPYAESPIMAGGITLVAGSPLLNSILDGTPPTGAVKLDVSGVDGRTTAYKYNLKTYVRTPLTLLSPGWTNSLSSADGMNVYTLKSAPVLLLSDKGNMVRAHVKEGGASYE